MDAAMQEPYPPDATHVDDPLHTPSIEQRGAVLMRLSVRFSATAQPEQWQELLRNLGLSALRESEFVRASFAALPARLEKLSPYLKGTVVFGAETAAKPGTAGWVFEWMRAPGGEPPGDYRATSGAVGGFPAVLERLALLWPVERHLKARVQASYLILASSWRLKPFLNAQGGHSDEQGLKALPTQWRLEPPGGGVLEKVTRDFDDETPEALELTGSGHYKLHLSPRFLNEIDGALWGGMKALLESQHL